MEYSFSTFRADSHKALEHVRREINTLRTGRASASLLDPVMVEAYGQQMRLVEVASISAPDPTLLRVSPWDKSLLESIERAISKSGLDLHPVVDGDGIRIAIPTLTEEKRKEMVKELHKKIEQGKVLLRTLRSDVKKDIESLEGDDGVSEDDIAASLEQLDTELKTLMEELDQMAETKEKELLTI
ncbi:MAG: ribosome recycling factor [Patescibacteria group bacterium]